MNTADKAEIRELTDAELEQVTGGASMVEYAVLMMAVLIVAAETNKK
jgi:lactobin A/cerein 7B family class IIb bacteriocin